MRLIRASLADAYKVHKTMSEYMEDCGDDPKTIDGNYDMWLRRLTDEERIYLLLLHGRKCVGMIWGEALKNEPKRTILLEGRYLRRAYRGKIRFTRALFEGIESLVKEFEVVRLMIPRVKKKIPSKYKILGTLVEV